MHPLHVKTIGEGPNLVMLHGWAMHSGIWSSVQAQLSYKFRLHLIDLPGHGYSADVPAASLEEMVEMISAVLPPTSILCGWSLGGQIAIKLALRLPEQIDKLILVATTPSFIKRDYWQWGMDEATVQLFMNNLEKQYIQTINRFFTLQMKGSSDSSTTLMQLRNNFFGSLKPNEQSLKVGLQILLTTDLREAVGKLTLPVLLIHGRNDVITDCGAAEWMHQQLVDSKLDLYQRCGHAPFLSYPNQFVASLYDL